MKARGRPKVGKKRDFRMDNKEWSFFLKACRVSGINPSEYIRIKIEELIEKTKLKE